jgi:hypothetical protein
LAFVVGRWLGGLRFDFNGCVCWGLRVKMASSATPYRLRSASAKTTQLVFVKNAKTEKPDGKWYKSLHGNQGPSSNIHAFMEESV